MYGKECKGDLHSDWLPSSVYHAKQHSWLWLLIEQPSSHAAWPSARRRDMLINGIIYVITAHQGLIVTPNGNKLENFPWINAVIVFCSLQVLDGFYCGCRGENLGNNWEAYVFMNFTHPIFIPPGIPLHWNFIFCLLQHHLGTHNWRAVIQMEVLILCIHCFGNLQFKLWKWHSLRIICLLRSLFSIHSGHHMRENILQSFSYACIIWVASWISMYVVWKFSSQVDVVKYLILFLPLSKDLPWCDKIRLQE